MKQTKYWIGIIFVITFSGVSFAQSMNIGRSTGFPIPRFVSMKKDKGYARRGPSQIYRIDWVFQHKDQPLMITDEDGSWRLIKDQDGQGGWMHKSLLSGKRTVVVVTALAPLHRRANRDSVVIAKAQKGVIAQMTQCTENWCKITTDTVKGWIERPHIWGILKDEFKN